MANTVHLHRHSHTFQPQIFEIVDDLNITSDDNIMIRCVMIMILAIAVLLLPLNVRSMLGCSFDYGENAAHVLISRSRRCFASLHDLIE